MQELTENRDRPRISSVAQYPLGKLTRQRLFVGSCNNKYRISMCWVCKFCSSEVIANPFRISYFVFWFHLLIADFTFMHNIFAN